ncbi:MAG: hypothetical protein C0603_06475 [Denitrovibrio sp.]|nr:MAG: hypothetical protein C0603_06475 [Denitrovibrio sp.]
MKKLLLPLLAIVLFAALFGYPYFKNKTTSKETLHIAFSGPLSGENAAGGRSVIQAIELYVDHVNKSGGVNGRRLQLDKFDDMNNAKIASDVSIQIAKDSEALAVIGHNWSSTSMAAAPNYMKYGIPAISPTATSVNVTKDNPWFFRTVPNDNTQGKFITHYIKNVLREDKVTIVQHDSVYGEYLSKVMTDTAENIDLEVSEHYVVYTEQKDTEKQFTDIIEEIKNNPESGVIFIAMYETKGAEFVRLLKDAEVENRIITPDAFASSTFTDQFSKLPKEILSPGFYTNGIYVSCPMIFDTANEQAQSFYHDYQMVYGELPDWSAASAYDAVMMAVEAIRLTNATGSKKNIPLERSNIQKFLASVNNPAAGIVGVTGKNYFSSEGDAIKPLNIGVYQKGGNVSSLIQLQSIQHPKLAEKIPEEDIVAFDQFLLTKTNVVYTGISVNKIDELDFGKRTFFMDFNIWFRSRPDIRPEDIVFTNAVEPIELGELVRTEFKNGLQYKLFRVKGKFRADFLPSFDIKKHTLSISFRHKTIQRANLIYVVDVVGMGIKKPKELMEKFKENQILNPVYNWEVQDLIAYQDIEKADSLGEMDSLYSKDGSVNFSRYNYKMFVKEQGFDLFEFVSIYQMFIVFLVSIGVFAFFRMLKLFVSKDKFDIFLWLSGATSIVMLMICLQKLTIDWMVGKVDDYYLRTAMIGFDILWWIIPVWVIILGVDTFFWHPLEMKTQKRVPSLIKRITAFVIILFAFFGIIAFVFDQKITSLLATSGAVAMIIGFAIQVNIANIFSGIILNIDSQIKIGDWIMVHGRTNDPSTGIIGCVVDIGWRTTQLKTTDNSLVLIPNSTFADKVYTNFMLPEETSRFELSFCLPFSVAPEIAIKMINQAALAVTDLPEGPSSSPKKPKAAVAGVDAKGMIYKLRYWLIPREVSPAKCRNTIIQSVMENLKDNGVTIAYPKTISFIKQVQPKVEIDDDDDDD